MNNTMLRGRIIQKYGTLKNFVKPMGLTYPTILAKLSGSSDWTSSEILKVCDLLDIKAKHIPDYFFAEEVK